MKQLAMLAGICVLMTTTSCLFFDEDPFCENGRGDRVTEILNLPEFTGIHLGISATVFLKQGAEQKVEVFAQENIIEILERDVSNGVWDIEFEKCVFDFKDVEITITLTDLDEVKISSSGDIIGLDEFEVDDVELAISGSGDMELDLVANSVDVRISGSGDMELDLVAETIDTRISSSGDFDADIDADDLDVKITGSGDCQVEGTVEDLEVSISSSGDFHGFDLESHDAMLRISGSGDIQCWVTDTMDVTISGSGSVYYIGYPSIDVEITGSGNLVDKN